MIKENPKLTVGLIGSIQKTITKQDTALNFGSGALKNILAAPTLAALMIEAAVKAVDPLLPEQCITVGKTCSFVHQEPTVEGMTVTVEAKLIEVDMNRLVFEITAYDELGRIGTGTHERFIVKYNTFMDKVAARCNLITDKIN